jgi:glycerophosphoryl diester phosphodiesterase
VIAHRGAPRRAPENTIASFRAAVELGVDAVEFDVVAMARGPLVVAHSDHLEEITQGRAEGRIGDRSLVELRALAPDLPTLDETLAWFADEGRAVGLHIDLKLGSRLDEVALAVDRHGLADRVVVSAFHSAILRQIAAESAGIRLGFTYPEDRLGISRRRALWPLVRLGLSTMRATVPMRLERLLAPAGATVVMLNHTLVTPRAVSRAHEIGVPVLTWTVDDPTTVVRVVEAGVDGVISNDPEMVMATLAS